MQIAAIILTRLTGRLGLLHPRHRRQQHGPVDLAHELRHVANGRCFHGPTTTAAAAGTEWERERRFHGCIER